MDLQNLKIAKDYYEGWETKDVSKLKLFSGLKFTSPDSMFNFADDFLKACWHLAGVKLENKQFISDGNIVCVKYEINSAENGSRHYSEWLTIEGGEIREIEVFYGSK
ncbi:MAG TPA: hypothetical protein VJ455_06465 [Ignavibacteria bacterium]|nr:hypothetical protein [Ignavibacteria bacterium]